MARFIYKNNTVNIDDDLLARYSREAGPVTGERLPYFAVTSGYTDDMPSEEIEKRIVAAISAELAR